MTLGQAARIAARELARAPTAQKDEALRAMAAKIRRSAADIAAEKQTRPRECAGARPEVQIRRQAHAGWSRIEALAKGLDETRRASRSGRRGDGALDEAQWPGFFAGEGSIGVIGIIYESRPNVTADAGGLCMKSGNAAILRGGSDSFHSSAPSWPAAARAGRGGVAAHGVPDGAHRRPRLRRTHAGRPGRHA